MLVGHAVKNGILIVEFTNQLRDQGMQFTEALVKASEVRFRPILMTSLTTIAGTVPLIISSGAGGLQFNSAKHYLAQCYKQPARRRKQPRLI